MAVTCPVDRSDLVQPLAGDLYQCLSCYAHFDVHTKEVLTDSGGGSSMPTPGEYQ